MNTRWKLMEWIMGRLPVGSRRLTSEKSTNSTPSADGDNLLRLPEDRGNSAASVQSSSSVLSADNSSTPSSSYAQSSSFDDANVEKAKELTAQLSIALDAKSQLIMRNQIYCSGSLLEAVQNSKLFTDSKHFVDMPLKHDAESVLMAWNLLLQGVENGQIDPAVLNTFIHEHFEQPGGELVDHQPTDFNSEEQFNQITDPHYRSWAQELHRKWPTLCRRVSEKVLSEPERFSLIAVPKPFVVPGGRFREMYYWDSFFTIKGLLASGMFGTVRGMIENMGHLIDMYGFVPNGNRVYYLNRSQPPLLTWCLHAYFLKTHDVEFVRSAIVWLEKEMKFFTDNKKFHRPEWKAPLFRYHVVAQGPRPESYREDVESAEHIQDAIEKCRLWGDIAAAAESGRDFSARWFHNEGPMAGKMGSTRTSSILPVDLNSIICGNLRIFADFYDSLGNHEAAARAREQFELMRETIHQIFWNEQLGCWFDYDIITQRHIDQYFDTNFFPLFCGCTHEGFDGRSIVDYLERAGVMSFPGGLPTSLITSGQQWDFPNAWAPTTWVIIQGLRATGQTDLARIIAEKWIRRNYTMWLSSGGRMFEKYNVATGCTKQGGGGGGEYEVQEGFGWTNGVILDLLTTYNTELAWVREGKPAYDESDCECCKAMREKLSDEAAAAVAAATTEGGQPLVIIVPSEQSAPAAEGGVAAEQPPEPLFIVPAHHHVVDQAEVGGPAASAEKPMPVSPEEQQQQHVGTIIVAPAASGDSQTTAPIIILPGDASASQVSEAVHDMQEMQHHLNLQGYGQELSAEEELQQNQQHQTSIIVPGKETTNSRKDG